MGVCVAVMSVEAQVSGTLISGKKERERCVREGRRKEGRKEGKIEGGERREER